MPSGSDMKMMRTIGAAGVLAGALALTGCTSVMYDSNPQAPAEEATEKPDYASRTVQNLLATCIGWAVERYPPPAGEQDGWFAVNLPPGLTREQYIEVARQIGERAAPLTPEVAYLPTYHIGWVWMRGDDARVDVIRPVYALSTAGEPVYQTITLHLSRRYASWRVDRTQPWEPGVVPVPESYYLPELPPEEVEALEAKAEPSAEIAPEDRVEAQEEEAPFDAYEGAEPIEEEPADDGNSDPADEPADPPVPLP